MATRWARDEPTRRQSGVKAMFTLEQITQVVGEAAEARLREAVDGEGVLHVAMAYHLETGGKRLRALLPSWVAANLGADPETALPLGVAVELIHNGTLVHDDVQDGDAVRRGRPAVWKAYGLPQAVNVGTWLMYAGCREVLRGACGHAVIGDVHRAVMRVIEGQAREFELQRHPSPTPQLWEAMARAKTGALFAVAYRMGAAAAGEAAERADGLAAYGEALGLFFQLQDDLLDLLGDKGRDERATDIAEGKISHPVSWAAAWGNETERRRLLAIVHAPRAATDRAMVAEALDILHGSGAIDASLKRLQHLAADLAGSPWAFATPGLIERVLSPLAHALPG